MLRTASPLSPAPASENGNKTALKAIIIAAGRGARLAPLTEECPKCLLPVNGKPILEYQLEAFRQNGIEDMVIIKGFQAEKIAYPGLKSYLNEDYLNNNILCSLMTAAPEMDGPFVASYSDIVYSPQVITELLASPHDIAVVVDMDWKEKYVGRTQHPESEAEKAAVDTSGRVIELGKKMTRDDLAVGEFIGLFKCSEKGAKLFREAFQQAVKDFDGKPFYHAPSLQKAYVTDMLNHLISLDIDVHVVPVYRGWYEIDTEQDLQRAREWMVRERPMMDQAMLRAQGQRILSELNDFKRTINACADELGWDRNEVSQIIQGDTTPARMMTLIQDICAAYPINRADLELQEDDTTDGVKLMRAAESEKTSRIFERRDRNGSLTPYYEYRDTATSRLCAFRPEWIKELRVVSDSDPANPDAIYNNGHFMHQVTFFVGPVNFYYQIGEKKVCEEMETGDSNYITPYFPHSFTSRNADEEAYIVAVTFGGDVRRSLDELYRMGPDRAKAYLVNTRHPVQGTQDLLDFHLENELQTREILQQRLIAAGKNIDVINQDNVFTTDDLAILAQYLSIEPSDLALPPYRPEEEVVVCKIANTNPFFYPSNSQADYKIWPGARCRRMPLVKAFNLQVLSETSAEKFSYGLHSYIFNYSQAPATLVWKFNGRQHEDVLNPGDSATIQPFVSFGFQKGRPEDDPRLFVVGIPGTVNLSTQREMSAFAEFDRVVAEDKCWFTA